jgi:hypothetical protein
MPCFQENRQGRVFRTVVRVERVDEGTGSGQPTAKLTKGEGLTDLWLQDSDQVLSERVEGKNLAACGRPVFAAFCPGRRRGLRLI